MSEADSEADGFVFVSSGLDDAERVDGLLELLNLAGVHTWSARSIPAGASWSAEILSAIRRSDSVLVFLSQSSVESAALMHEIEYATDHGKPTLPILLDPMELPLVFATYHALDLTPVISDLNLAAALILQALPRSSVSPAPVATPESANKGYMFLSYADQDRPFADRLKLFLKDRGYAYWDYRESDRDYHVALSLELEEVIMRAAAVACVLSPDWKRSKWTLRELFFADEAGKPYLLLLARAMGPTLATAGMTFIDFESDIDWGFQQLDRDLQRKGL